MSELKSQNRKHKKGIECNIRFPYKISCGNNNPLFYHNYHTNKNLKLFIYGADMPIPF